MTSRPGTDTRTRSRGTGRQGTRDRAAALLAPGFVAAVTVGYLLPLLVDSLHGTKEFRPITAPAVPDPPAVGYAATAGNALVLVACLVVLVVHRRRWRDLLGPVLLLVGAWAVALGVLLAHGSDVPRVVVLVPLVLAAATVLRPGRETAAAIGGATAAVAALGLVLGALVPSAGRYVRPEALADEKPVGSWGILAGVLPSGNNLGLVLALGVPAVLLLRRAWLRWASLAVVLVALVWTASRTSWIAAAAALLTVLVLRAGGRWRDLLAALALGAAGTANLVVPLVVSDPTTFTNRATYWIAGLDAWQEAPVLGHGADYYTVVAREGGTLGGYAYHAHNQLVQLLVTGGLVLVLLVGAALVVAAVRAVRAAPSASWPAAFLVALLCAALFEVPLGIVDRVMFLPFALLPLAVVLAWHGAPGAPAVAVDDPGPAPGAVGGEEAS